MPHHKNANEKGDIVVRFDIQFPMHLNARQKELVQQALV